MNKQTLLIFLMFSLALAGIIIFKRTLGKKKVRWTIGILQTATHPALDAVKEGFIKDIKKALGNDLEIILQNAEGSVNNMHTMAQSLHMNREIDLILAIATPAAQSLVSIEKQKPIIFSAVTDPKAAGLCKSNRNNVCGTIDMIDVNKQIALLQSLLPSVKTVALLFNKGEINAQALVHQMHQELEKQGISVIEFGVTSEAEIPAAVEVACRKADVILTPTDNTVACTIELIATTARRMNTPLIVSDNLLVAQGALAAHGVDYTESGRKAAKLAQQILLEHKSPHELPLSKPDCKAIINKKEFDRMQLTLPDNLSKEIEFITFGGS